MEILARAARADDADALAHLSQRVFAATYGAAIPAAVLNEYLAREFSAARVRAALADERVLYRVAQVSAEVAALSQMARGEKTRAEIELEHFYVDANFQGRGLAAQLLADSIETARGRGFNAMRLCVWQENLRAVAFYQKHGFAIVGRQEVWVEEIVFHDWVMRREA